MAQPVNRCWSAPVVEQLLYTPPFPIGYERGDAFIVMRQATIEWLKRPVKSIRELQLLMALYDHCQSNTTPPLFHGGLLRIIVPNDFEPGWGEPMTITEEDVALLDTEWAAFLALEGEVLNEVDYLEHYLPSMLAFDLAETETEWPTNSRFIRGLRLDRLILQFVHNYPVEA